MHETGNRRLTLPLLFFAILLSWQGFNSSSVTAAEHHSATESATRSPAGGREHATASAAAWRKFIWESLPPEWLSGDKSNEILEAYEKRDWKPFFFTSRFEPASSANALIQTLEQAETEGIDPKPYHLDALRQRIDNLSKLRHSLKQVDPSYEDSRPVFSDLPSFGESGSSTAHAAVTNGPGASSSHPSGQASPETDREMEVKYREVFREASEIDIELANRLMKYSREMNPFSRDELVRTLAGEVPVTEFIRKLEPASPHYSAILKAYAKYRRLASAGGQTPVNGKPSLKPGERGESVSALQKRLQQEEFYKGKTTGVYDAETQEAVRKFQRSHLLQADGAMGAKTKDWLNVSFKKKADMLAQALKLLRDSQTRRFEHERFVRINIPEFILEYYKEDRIQSVHRIIVGKASGKKVKLQGRMMGENQTPSLASAIEQVIINPRWYVSDRIRLELNSEASKDPNWFAKHGYVQMSSHYPWGQPRIFQLPGPKNALGRVKFEFPNPYAIYLHDTPRKQLFSSSRRDFSHGCIRVDKADGLAHTLLADDGNPADKKVESYLALSHPTHIKLSSTVPIIIEYVPASSTEDGQPIFLGDPYGWFSSESDKKS